jgi:23S rRNA (guanine745-N1)-methyltransferase
MRDLPLACTVRGCGLPLERRELTVACPKGHSYDIARSGYINLLQPQDRRSLGAGDTREMVAARQRLFDAHVGETIVDAFATRAATLDLPEAAVGVELGAGSGDVLAAVGGRRPITTIGIDLSVAAAEQAARRYPNRTWVVANADRRLPLRDSSVHLVLSMHARRNPSECARILCPGGFLLAAVPAQDDLVELRAAIQGTSIERSRVEALIAEHAPFFEVLDRMVTRERRRLDRDTLRDLLRSTYRGARGRAASRVDRLNEMDVTLASDLVLFGPRRR